MIIKLHEKDTTSSSSYVYNMVHYLESPIKTKAIVQNAVKIISWSYEEAQVLCNKKKLVWSQYFYSDLQNRCFGEKNIFRK